MEKIQNYEILEKIGETTGSLIYRGRKVDTKNTVIIKTLKVHFLSQPEIIRFKQEYEILKKIDFEGIIKVYEIISHKNEFVLILEDFSGISIKEILDKKKTFDIKSFLKIAINISKIIGELHNNNIIHRNIKPCNILINQHKDRIKITNFGIFFILTHENEQIYDPNIIQGTLLYISPEQTGRTNRVVDYRTDLYSLGITFYKMITGSVPFESKDPLEIIHSHIAREPVSPFEQKSEIPKTISDIIMKLISKNAEDRYQNAFGLMADLNECLKQIEAANSINPFELAKHDISNRFIIPQKLFGREKELGLLISAFEHVSGRTVSENLESNRSEIMLVTGAPGIGKSALINELNKPVMDKGGYFLSGKYEQFRTERPYSSIIQAFQKFLRYLLTVNDEKIEELKKKILKALGSNGKIITDIIPELELIIGKQPDVPELAPNEAKNRFNIVFKKFLCIFTKKDHPIALFLDDLQWIDPASLELIINLITSPDIKYLLIIGSYRDNEVTESHPLIKALKEIEKARVNINRITLSTLSVNNIKDLIVNFLKCSKERGFSLADLIHKKTGNNPFFVNEFLQTLYNEKLIVADPNLGWKWDIDKISQMNITDNVVEFLSQKINKLPEKVKYILKMCACVGNRFDLEILSFLLDISIDETLMILTEAINEGFITIKNDLYMFDHDRIQESAYSLIPDKEKPLIHYKIGKLMLEKTAMDDLENKLFYIVDQLNLGSSLIKDSKEREELACMNCKSGMKAKKSAAFSLALRYCENGMNLLEKKCWEKQYDLALNIYTEAAETACLIGDYDTMERYISRLIKSSKNIYDSIPMYVTKINAYDAQMNFKKSVDIVFNVFKRLNYSIPKNPGKAQIFLAILKIRPHLSLKKIDSLINLPEMTNPKMLAVSQMLTYLSKSAYFISPNLFVFAAIKQIELSIKYGQCQAQVIAYIEMAVLLTCIFSNIEAGYKLGNLGLKLGKKLNARGYEARALSLFNSSVANWKEHLNSVRPGFMKSYYIGMETGDLEWTALSIFKHDYLGILVADPLTELEAQMVKNHKAIEQLKQIHFLGFHSIVWQMALNLLGKSKSPTELTGLAVNEKKMIPLWKTSNAKSILGFFYINRLMLRYLFLDYQGAIVDSNISNEYLDAILGFETTRDHAFFSSLVRLMLYSEVTKSKKREYRKFVMQSLKKFRKWVKHAPMNNEHRIKIIHAEIARVRGNYTHAEANYDKAIELSRKNEYLIEEAISNELAGKYYISRKCDKLARIYLQDAYSCYKRWGATAKLKHLLKVYPEIFAQINDVSRSTISNDLTTSVTTSQLIDLATVVKASQAISGEVNFRKLLEKMMKIAIENAGAQKGFMMLKNKGIYLVEAEGTIKSEEIKVLKSIPVDTHKGLSPSIVNFVARTQDILILNDVSNEGDFTSDPYVIKNKPKSILCMPIINQAKLIAILYLENDLSTGVFTQERLEILNILSSQMAISIKNARFYEELESKVRERTEEVKKSEKRFKDIVFSSADWVWEFNEKGVYTYCSEKIEDLLGYKQEEIIGKTPFDLMPKKEARKAKKIFTQITKNKKHIKDLERWNLTKNGNRICLLTNGIPILDRQGNLAGYRGVDKDITERKESEIKLKELTEKLSHSNQELEQFAYIASHDLQEPLRKIRTFGDKLKSINKNNHDEKYLDYIKRMQNAVKRMQALISGLLDYSRVTTKSQPFEEVNLNKIVNDVISDIEITVRETGGKIKIEKLPVICADELQMRQLFQNIICNALKYHKDGVSPTIMINSKKKNKFYEIIISDNGIGFDQKNSDRIFEIFQRLVSKSEYEGTGIGLAICKRIVKRHGGEIKTESKIGEGSTFRFTLKIKH